MLIRPLAIALVLGVGLQVAPGADDAGIEYFEKQVRPMLVARCYECHSGKAKRLEGKLRLDSLAAALAGGETGPAVVPGKPKESLLVDAINYGELYQMPPKGKLPAEEIAVLTKWVEMGAPWPKEEPSASAASSSSAFDLAQRKAEHWCWQPITKPAMPEIRNPQSAIRNPLDAFILAKLEAKGLSPAPPADRRTLIRRVYFDLIGLPPTPEEVEAFLQGRIAAGVRESSSTSCSTRPTSASAGGGIGSTWCATPNRAGMSSTHEYPERLRVSRLRHSGAQRRRALRPVRHRAHRRRSVAEAAAESDRTASTSRSSAPASGFSASGFIRRSISARTSATGSTTCSTC